VTGFDLSDELPTCAALETAPRVLRTSRPGPTADIEAAPNQQQLYADRKDDAGKVDARPQPVSSGGPT